MKRLLWHILPRWVIDLIEAATGWMLVKVNDDTGEHFVWSKEWPLPGYVEQRIQEKF